MSKYDPMLVEEEYTNNMLRMEREKWDREQRHMESQILNVIDTTLKTQELIQKDVKKTKELELMKKKKAQDLATLKKKRDVKRNKAYINAQEREKLRIKEMKESIIKNRRRYREAKERREQENAQNESETHRKKPRRKVPAYVSMRRKTNRHNNRIYEENEQIEMEVQDALEELDHKDSMRDHLIQEARRRQQSNLNEALNKVEANRLRASQQHKQKLDVVADKYIHKLIKINKYGEKKELEIKEKNKEKDEEYKKTIKKMKEFKKQKYLNKKAKLNEYMQKKQHGIQNMQRFLRNQKKQIKEQRKMNAMKEEMVKERYYDNLIEWRNKGTDLMEEINRKHQKVLIKRLMKEELIENRKKMLEELSHRKDEFKDSFGLFNTGSMINQKKAINKLKAYGLKNDNLIDRLREIEEEEMRKLMEEEEKKKKAKEEALGY